MLLGGVAGIGQVLEMIPDLIFLTLTLILIPVAFFTADQIRNGTELIVDGTNVTDQDVGESLSSWFRASPLSRRASMAF